MSVDTVARARRWSEPVKAVTLIESAFLRLAANTGQPRFDATPRICHHGQMDLKPTCEIDLTHPTCRARRQPATNTLTETV